MTTTGRRPRFSQARAAAIAAEAAAAREIPLPDFYGHARDRSIAHPRQDTWRRLHEEFGMSLPSIGRMFGRDHTTILHGIRASRARSA